MSSNRRRSSGGDNTPPNAAWMHQQAQMMANTNNMTPQQQAQVMANANMTQQRQLQQQQQQQQQRHQQAANANAANMQGLNQGLNIAHLTPQQQQKLQMMQLHDRLKQQGGGGDLGDDNVNPAGGNVVNPGNSGVPAQQQQQQLAQQQQLQQQQQQLQQHHAQQMQQMQQMQQRRHSQQAVQQANSRMQPNIGQRGNMVQQQPNNIGQGGNTNPNQVMQMMQMQGQPQQLTHSQQQQLIQNIQMQQQQIRQLQMAQPQGKMAQALQGQMQIGGRMIQALEEQKVRYSSQLQQFHGPTSDGQLQQLQGGQMSRSTSVTSHHTDPRGAGTPLSPSMRSTSSRPSSARPSSTQPMIPPSRPPSQISQASAHSTSPQHAMTFQAQANALNLNSSYLPISTAKTKPSSMSRGASSASSSSHHVAFSTSVSTYSQPSLPSDLPAQGAMASAPGTAQTSEQAKDIPKQTTAFASKGKGKKTQRRNSVPHNSSLSYEEVADLANACTTEEKIVFVAKQVLSGGNANGFHKATAAMQRMKKQRMRAVKQKGEGGSSKKDEKPEDDEERIKRETFNVRMAKRMQSDMIEGLQFTNLMTDVIRSILEDIDPDNPLLLVQPPMIGTEADFASMPSSLPLLPADEIASAASTSSANAPHSPNHAGTANETVAEGTHGSTLRKLRKKSDAPSLASDDSLRKMVGTEDEDGNKLPKKEVSHRMLEANRFRTLLVGDHVAAKLSSQDLWILARVAKQYKAVASYQQMAGLGSKRDALFQEKVYIQDSDDYTGDKDNNARPVLRQHVLPLARTYGEASQWGSRIRKGYRVYALYPDTTTLYCATVVDSTTYCRDQDDIIVVQFDGDEDDNGELPERHIPARFVTLIPREFPASTKRKRRKSTTDGGGKKRSKDDMLVGMLGESKDAVTRMDTDELGFSTPGSTPPPGKQSRRQTKQPKHELASSHFG